MDTTPPPVKKESPPKDPPAETTVPFDGSPLYVFGIGTLIFLIIFHIGAAYLSYKKYQSVGWAIVNFFFATFYYPFYAFFLNESPPQSAMQSLLQTAGRRRRR